MRRVVCFCAFLLLPGWSSADPLPEALRDDAPRLQMVGAGEWTWLGASILGASLWTTDGAFRCCAEPKPVALRIQYRRKLRREDLVELALNEWERLRVADSGTLHRWGKWLAAVVHPRMGPGDTLVALVLPGKETRFYTAERMLGRITGPELGQALLAIWLDPRASNPELRAALLGTEVQTSGQ